MSDAKWLGSGGAKEVKELKIQWLVQVGDLARILVDPIKETLGCVLIVRYLAAPIQEVLSVHV